MVNAALSAVSLAAMGGAGRMLLGRRNGRTAVLVLIGCPGLLMMSHFIGGQIVTLCGLSLSFYALAMARRKTVKAIALTLLGWTVLSLSGSLLPLLDVMLATALLLLDTHWHNKRLKVKVSYSQKALLFLFCQINNKKIHMLNWKIFLYATH